MPVGMAFMFCRSWCLQSCTVLPGWSGVVQGDRFGALIGLFALGAFVLHNYVNLQIGAKLTVQQGVAYFVEWLATG